MINGDNPSLKQEAEFHLGRGSRFVRSILLNSRIVFSCFVFIFHVMKLWDCHHLLFLCTCWYCYSFLWYRPVCTNTFVRDRSLTEGSCYGNQRTLLVQNFENFLKWTISLLWWREINLRLTVTIDFNGSMQVEKIISHRKCLTIFRKWTKTKLYDRDWPV